MLSLALEERDFYNGAAGYFGSESLDQKVAELRERGLHFAQLPQDMRWLWREAVLFDPWGNTIKWYWAGEHRRYPPWRKVRAG